MRWASRDLIQFVTDRPGHDFRYAMNIQKITNDLGWQPQVTFKQGLADTIQWYQDNDAWLQRD